MIKILFYNNVMLSIIFLLFNLHIFGCNKKFLVRLFK